MTNLYANTCRCKGKHAFHVDHSEMLAMLLRSSYNVLLRRCIYRENSEDVKNNHVRCHAIHFKEFCQHYIVPTTTI